MWEDSVVVVVVVGQCGVVVVGQCGVRGRCGGRTVWWCVVGGQCGVVCELVVWEDSVVWCGRTVRCGVVVWEDCVMWWEASQCVGGGTTDGGSLRHSSLTLICNILTPTAHPGYISLPRASR